MQSHFQRHYSFIDYPLAIDVIKLRLHQIRHELEQRIAQSHTGNMMQCPSCERTYTTLNASLNLVSNTFECSFCGLELVEHATASKRCNEASDLISNSWNVPNHFWIILKKCDNWKIPTFDPKKWLIEQSKRRGMWRRRRRAKWPQELQWRLQRSVFMRFPSGTLTARSQENNTLRVESRGRQKRGQSMTCPIRS